MIAKAFVLELLRNEIGTGWSGSVGRDKSSHKGRAKNTRDFPPLGG